MTDTLRMLIMQVVSNIFAAIAALGLLDLSIEKFGVLTVAINSTLLLVAYFWKTGQGAPPTPPVTGGQ